MDNVKIAEALKTEKLIGAAAVEFFTAILENKKTQDELVALKAVLLSKLNSYLMTAIANKNTFAMALFADKANGTDGYDIVFTDMIESRTEPDIIDLAKNMSTSAAMAINLIDALLPSVEDGSISKETLLTIQDVRVFITGERCLANVTKKRPVANAKSTTVPNDDKDNKNDKVLISIDKEEAKRVAAAYEKEVNTNSKLLIGAGILLLGTIGYLAYKTYTAEDTTAAGIMDQGFAPIL